MPNINSQQSLRKTFSGLQGREKRRVVSGVQQQISEKQEQAKQYKEQLVGQEKAIQDYLQTPSGKLQYAKESGAKPIKYLSWRPMTDYALKQIPVYSTPYGEVVDFEMQNKIKQEVYKDEAQIASQKLGFKSPAQMQEAIAQTRALGGNVFVTEGGSKIAVTDLGTKQLQTELQGMIDEGKTVEEITQTYPQFKVDTTPIKEMTQTMDRTDATTINMNLQPSLVTGVIPTGTENKYQFDRAIPTRVELPLNQVQLGNQTYMITNIPTGTEIKGMKKTIVVPQETGGIVLDTTELLKEKVAVPIALQTYELAKDIKYPLTGMTVADVLEGTPIYQIDTKSGKVVQASSDILRAYGDIFFKGETDVFSERLIRDYPKTFETEEEKIRIRQTGIAPQTEFLRGIEKKATDFFDPEMMTYDLTTGQVIMTRPGGFWRKAGAGVTEVLIPTTGGELLLLGATGYGASQAFSLAPKTATALSAGFGVSSLRGYSMAQTPEEKRSAAAGTVFGFAPLVFQGGKWAWKKARGELILAPEKVIIKKRIPQRPQGFIEEQIGQLGITGKTIKGDTFQVETKGLRGVSFNVRAGERVKVEIKGGIKNWFNWQDSELIYSGSYLRDKVGYKNAIKLIMKRYGLTRTQAQKYIKETKPVFEQMGFAGEAKVLTLEEGGPIIDISGIKVSKNMKTKIGEYDTLGGRPKIDFVKSKGISSEIDLGKIELTKYDFRTLEVRPSKSSLKLKATRDISIVKGMGEGTRLGRDVEFYKSFEKTVNIGGRKVKTGMADITIFKGQPEMRLDVSEIGIGPSKTQILKTKQKLVGELGKMIQPKQTVQSKSLRLPTPKTDVITKIIPTIRGVDLTTTIETQESGVIDKDLDFSLSITGRTIFDTTPKVGEISLDIVSTSEKQKERQIPKIRGIQLPVIKDILRESQIPGLAIGQPQALDQSQSLKSGQQLKTGLQLKTSPQLRTTPTQIPRPAQPEPPIPKKPEPKPPIGTVGFVDNTFKKRRPTKTGQQKPDEYLAITKRYGKERVVARGKDPLAVIQVGKAKVKQTLGATLKIKTAKGKQIGLTPTREFRQSKTDPLAIVQRREARLGSLGERREIKQARRGILSLK